MILQPLRLRFSEEGHEAEAAHEAVHDAAAIADRLAVDVGDRWGHRSLLLLLMLLLLLLLLHDGVLVHAKSAAAAKRINVFYREENQAERGEARRHLLAFAMGTGRSVRHWSLTARGGKIDVGSDGSTRHGATCLTESACTRITHTQVVPTESDRNATELVFRGKSCSNDAVTSTLF